MNILICEHDDAYRASLCEAVRGGVAACGCAVTQMMDLAHDQDALDYVAHNKVPTLFFLDIDYCREHGGLELGRAIRERDRESVIVFLTSFAGQAQLTFKHRLHALDYIVRGADGLQQRINECVAIADAILNSDKKKLRLYSRSEQITIPFEDIYFLESANSTHRINIYHRNGTYDGRGTLKELFSRLDDNFVYCHKSFIVNRMNIRGIDRKARKITFDDGLCCWYSKEYARDVTRGE